LLYYNFLFRFRVNKPINLLDFGFCGPFKEERTHYAVHIELYEPLRKEIMPNCASRRVGKNQLEIDAEPNEIFYVGFDKPILIKPRTWYMLQFKIDVSYI